MGGSMNDLAIVYATGGLMGGILAFQILTRRFDPFAPIWLFFVGYAQIYVVQAINYHEWAVRIRGADLVFEANSRAFWALAWFLGVYFLGPGRLMARALPVPPERWSIGPVLGVCPVLLTWGLFCAWSVIRGPDASQSPTSAEASLVLSFPMVMLVAGVLLVVTGRQPSDPRPAFTAAGIAIILLYMLIWMFNGKRSHSLVAVLVGVCSFYVPRFKRPSYPVLILTALAGVMAVGISIGWRYYTNRDSSQRSFGRFVDFVITFDPGTILESVNMTEKDASNAHFTNETEEYGAYLLMMDTVPMKSEYDYGLNYLRVFSTFIPRIVWNDKPIYGRDRWISAWVAGSEMKREANFTGPAIGILGATHLNGGAVGTLIVLGFVATTLSLAHGYYRLHPGSIWVQAWWPLTYYNAWFMTVNDDPCNWFYYNYGFTTLPALVLLWAVNKYGGGDGS